MIYHLSGLHQQSGMLSTAGPPRCVPRWHSRQHITVHTEVPQNFLRASQATQVEELEELSSSSDANPDTSI